MMNDEIVKRENLHQEIKRALRRSFAALSRSVLLFSISLFTISPCWSADLGTTAAQVLEFPVSARAAAMGSAQGSAARDATALFYNAASLGTLRGGGISLMYGAHFEDTAHQSAAVAQQIGRFGTWAAGFQMATYGSFDEVDNTGQILGTKFTPNENAITLGVGKSVTEQIDLGLGLKRVAGKIKKTADTFSFDAGARVRFEKLALSVSAANLGGGLKYFETEDDLPQTFRLGSAYTKGKWVSAFDIVAPKAAAVYGALGGEYNFPVAESVCSLRAGFNTRNLSSDLDGIAGPSAGFGFAFRFWTVDYAWSPYGDLGDLHRVSIGFEWGHSEENASPAKQPEVRRAAQKLPAAPPPPRSPAESVKKIVAVAQLESRKVPPDQTELASEMIRSEFGRHGGFTVIDRKKMEEVLSQEGLQSSGCATEECASRVGRFLKAKIVVTGTLAGADKSYYLNVNAIDVDTEKIIASEWGEVKSPDRLAEESRALGRRLAILIGGQ